MAKKVEIQAIGTYRCAFPTKFGLPRQSGLAQHLEGYIDFEPQFCDRNFLRGIESYSHLWLLWQFSAAREGGATVRPPKLGGNTRLGVFATRSPFRPNRIGLSCVRFVRVETGAGGTLRLVVSGGDLMDGTPVFDIKPYLAYADAVPDAAVGFGSPGTTVSLQVQIPDPIRKQLPPELLPPLEEALAQDPRPGYQSDPDRVYVLPYAGFDVAFVVRDAVLTVCELRPALNGAKTAHS